MTPSPTEMTPRRRRWTSLVILIVLSCYSLPSAVEGHGRLLDPPSRSSMWRFGFGTDPNYNDNELFCGGYTVHFQRNGGKCGICGDAYHLPQPRANEAGGKYGKGIIVKRYSSGQTITAVVELTANHRGFFVFKLCPNNNSRKIATQKCLDQYPLEVEGMNGDVKYYVPNPSTGKFPVNLRLPEGLTCSQCVFQWTYTAGNNWGVCQNGTGKLGCGDQETFRGCADVSVSSWYDSQETNSANEDDDDLYNNVRQPSSTTRPRRPFKPHSPPRPKPTPTHKPISFTTRPRPRPTPSKPQSTRKNVRVRLTTARPSMSGWTTARTSTNGWTTAKPVSWSYATPARSRPTAAPKLTSYYIYVKPTKSTHKYNGNTIEQGNTKSVAVKKCKGVGIWKKLPGMDGWCDINCARGYCPPTHCRC